ncbi:MAG TPA: alpha/beta fold hydrolase [Gemmatimonadales bacterium]|nr:alpha/beta fold hydrolase [Gemmatimonadales bacterium]
MTALPTVDLTVYPFECDAFGHLNEASFLALFERARWDALAKGPGMDLFKRNQVWPAVRKATVDYRAGAFPGDVLRIETVLTDRGTTSFTMAHAARRVSDGVLVAEATLVFVCIDRAGRPAPLPDEVARALGGPRGTARDPLRVPVDGAELAVEVRGEGAPVLFIHGFPFDRTMWRHQLAALSKWKRIAPDLRGAGASSAPKDGYTIARYADDLVQVLDALRLDRAVICGLSMGGYILFELLRRHADRLRAAIFCNTKAEPDSIEAKRGRDELAAVAQRDGVSAVADRLLPNVLARSTFAAQPEVVAHVREMIGRAPVTGLVGALRALRDRVDSTPVLAAIAVPVLVVAGADDQIAPSAGMRAMAQAIPGAQFAEIPAAGHLAPLEQPLAASRVLADFLEGLR